ncbi:MAG TPA: 6-phosphogluconolactonase, partial [Anaerolineae bacterium]|nr:6-phosphogluconolactonase [Anaerolineae bacterium]
LFPGRAGVLEEEAWVVGVEGAPKAPPVRLTMTLPLLRQGRQIVMMVTGEAKKEAVFETLLGENDVSRYPLQGIEGGEGEVRWLLDEGAAALLLNSS